MAVRCRTSYVVAGDYTTGKSSKQDINMADQRLNERGTPGVLDGTETMSENARRLFIQFNRGLLPAC
jgi:hypothetical protein